MESKSYETRLVIESELIQLFLTFGCKIINKCEYYKEYRKFFHKNQFTLIISKLRLYILLKDIMYKDINTLKKRSFLNENKTF